jgi:hypothetical protein
VSTEPLTALAPNLWIATRPLSLAVGDVGARMTVVRLPDGGLFVHSPVRLDAETRAALDTLGSVRYVVAPSRVHHLFVGDYATAYPTARLFAAPGLAEKRTDLRFDGVLSDDAPSEWRGLIDQHLFRGAPYINEVAFFHRASRTLILTDLAFNITRPARGRVRLFFALIGAVGHLGPHRLTRLLIRDRTAAKASVQRILTWDFDRVIVAHGDVLERGGAPRLIEGFAFLG